MTMQSCTLGTTFAIVYLAAVSSAFANNGALDFSFGDAAFSVTYFKQSFNRSINSVVSPVAVRLTFAALCEVADLDTKSTVQRAFFLPTESAEARNNAVQFVDDLQQSRFINVSFGVFKINETLSPELADSVRTIFKVEPRTVAFADRQTVVQQVNRWAEEATEGLVPDYLTEGDIDVNEELLLLNALHLRADWAQKFPPERTTSETFEYLDGPAEVDLMSASMRVLYKANEKFHTVQIPYSEASDLTMWILLPHRGGTLDELANLLSADLLEELETSFMPKEVDLWLPKFTVQYSHKPRDVLEKLGHGTIFEGSNFATFASHKSTVAGLKQSVFITVDENGTEAAAVTSVGTKFRVKNTQFTANKPFIFLIKKISTDMILFIGHYSNRNQH